MPCLQNGEIKIPLPNQSVTVVGYILMPKNTQRTNEISLGLQVENARDLQNEPSKHLCKHMTTSKTGFQVVEDCFHFKEIFRVLLVAFLFYFSIVSDNTKGQTYTFLHIDNNIASTLQRFLLTDVIFLLTHDSRCMNNICKRHQSHHMRFIINKFRILDSIDCNVK